MTEIERDIIRDYWDKVESGRGWEWGERIRSKSEIEEQAVADIDRLLGNAATLEADITALRAVLRRLVGVFSRQPCTIVAMEDGRPLCTMHNYSPPCPVAEARAIETRLSEQAEGVKE